MLQRRCLIFFFIFVLQERIQSLHPSDPYNHHGSCMPMMSICYYELRASTAMTMFYKTLFRVIANENGVLQNYQNSNQIFSTEEILTADGYPKLVYVFNESLPGPVLHAYQNQTIRIRIYNDFSTQTLSVHFHGIRQIGTPQSDGIGQVTQLSIVPGSSFLHEFIATDVGTFWYHSHVHSQTAMGLLGGFIVHPKSKPDIVCGEFVLMLQDWQHFYTGEQHDLLIDSGQFYPNSLESIFDSENIDYLKAVNGLTETTALVTSILINGRGQYIDPRTKESSTNVPLEILKIEPQKYETYRLRLINGGNAFSLKFSIDEHELHVIATDGIPLNEHIVVDQLIIGLGERFDVLLVNTSNRDATKNYWIRVDTLDKNNNPRWHGQAILQYTSDSTKPTTNRQICTALQPCRILNCPFSQYGPMDSYITCLTLRDMTSHEQCLDQTLLDEKTNINIKKTLSLTMINSGGEHGYESFNFIRMTLPKMTEPILYNPQKARELSPCSNKHLSMNSGEKCYHHINVQLNDIVEFLLINVDSDQHPLHLHGSFFHIIEQGLAVLNETTGEFITNNQNIKCQGHMGMDCTCQDQNQTCSRTQMRLIKDTIQLPSGGYMRIRFRGTNPGVWLFHCHTESHMSRGMVIMIHIAEDQIHLSYSSIKTLAYKLFIFLFASFSRIFRVL